VRVPESELDAVPHTLRALDGEAADRGQAARTAWEEWFAPDVVFHRAAEAIARLMSRSNGELSNGLPLTDPQFLRVWTSRALRVNLARARGLVHHLRAPHAFSVRD
jgi:hypothetical protein